MERDSIGREIVLMGGRGTMKFTAMAAAAESILTSSCAVVAFQRQEHTFTPPHKKNRRGKFKRSGK